MTYTLIDHVYQMDSESHEDPTQFTKISTLCMNVICEHYEISIYDIMKRIRTRPIPEARFLYFFAMSEAHEKVHRSRYKYPLRKTGGVFGMDHATVLHGIKFVESNLKVNRISREEYRLIFERLYRCGYRYPLERYQEIMSKFAPVEKFI
jgi:chromosomal replication initiation ATPase DnaA